VPVPHVVLGLQVAHDSHLLLETAHPDDRCRNPTPLLLLDGGEYEAGPCFGHGGPCSTRGFVSFLCRRCNQLDGSRNARAEFVIRPSRQVFTLLDLVGLTKGAWPNVKVLPRPDEDGASPSPNR
jgi:hypothetical protein